MFDIDYVRVKDLSTGHELTLVRSAAEADPDAYKILKDQDAVDHNDQPLPPVFADDQATPKKTAAKKTASKRAATKKTAATPKGGADGTKSPAPSSGQQADTNPPKE